MTSARIRPIEDRDYETLASTLNSAFGSYRDATVFTTPMLAYFREWMWSNSPSLVLSENNRMQGVLLAGFRTTRFGSETLRVLHIGPFGIEQPYRRQGWGTKMLRALTRSARDCDVDLLTLTTESIYGAHRLYRREGFDSIEAFRPKLLMLSASHRPTLSEKGHSSSGIRPQCSQETLANHLVEIGPDGPPLPAALRPHHWELEGGHATSIQWSIVTRQGDRETRQKVTQLIDWQPGQTPDTLFEAARERATADGSVCIYALSELSKKLPQLESKGSSLVYRMGRSLTDKGASAMEGARHYTAIAPAP